MIEIPSKAGDEKIVVRGADLATLKLELHRPEQSLAIADFTRSEVETMRNRAANAGNGFSEELVDRATLLSRGEVSLGLNAVQIDFSQASSYQEVRNGVVVAEIQKSSSRQIMRPTQLLFLKSAAVPEFLAIECDLFMMRRLATALAEYL